MDTYRTVAAELRYVHPKIKGSRFEVTVTPVGSIAEAKEALRAAAAELPDAGHHCFAYRIGPDGRETRADDDGEPAGSAGPPILKQIEGHDLTDLVVIVARWFGGTKLGVGGLIRAYGGAAGVALDNVRIRTVLVTSSLELRFPYECSGPVQGLLTAYEAETTASEYGADVELSVRVARSRAAAFADDFRDCTAGRGELSS